MDKMSLFGNETKEKKTTAAFGIDLGTTNSAISLVPSGTQPVIVNLSSGRTTMPSCVMWEGKERGFTVGKKAYENRYRHNCIYSVKKLMQDPNAKVTLKYNDESITMTPAEISAEILKGLVKETNNFYGEVKDVVVTVPAYFNANGIKATREACILAGLNPVGILAEPTAAALNYDIIKDNESKNIIVFDLGGGTFDVSLIRLTKNSNSNAFNDIFDLDDDTNTDEEEKLVSVIGLGGDANLGGDDYDKEIYNILCQKLRECGVNTDKISLTDKNRLILRLENYKKHGIDSTYLVKVGLNLTDNAHTRIDETVTITPGDFRRAFDPIYERTKSILDQVLSEHKVDCKDIVLVGGSTKNPYLLELLSRDYPDFNISNSINPDESVATGAAIRAKLEVFGDTNIKIFDALPMTIGVLTNGVVKPIIMKNSQLPVVKAKAFTTVEDNQTEMAVQIYQGNSKLPEECVELGSIYFEDIAPRPVGEPKLSLKVSIDVNGLLKCFASIDGISKMVELKLAGDKQSKELSDVEKNILKFRRMANNLKDRNKIEEFNKMIDSYPKYVGVKDLMSAYRGLMDNADSE